MAPTITVTVDYDATPAAPPLVVGATTNDVSFPGPGAAFTAADNLIGPLKATRVFQRALPATHTPFTPSGVQEIISYKSTTDANMESFLASLRPGSLLCYYHEPENVWDKGADFVASWNTEYDRVTRYGGELGTISMTYRYAYGPKNAADGSFLPDPAKCAWYGADDYQGGVGEFGYGSIRPIMDDPAFATWWGWVKDIDRPRLLTEYGRGITTYDPGAAVKRAAVIPQDHVTIKGLGITHWLYWYEHGQGGVNQLENDYRFTDQPSVDAWSAVCAQEA